MKRINIGALLGLEGPGRAMGVLSAVVLVLAFASTAAAQAGLTDPPPSADPPAAPTPSPTPSPDAPPAGKSATPTPISTQAPDPSTEEATSTEAPSEDAPETDTTASETDAEPTKRVDAVPEEGEGASSDRIQYRDPLDIDQVSMKLKWSNFISGIRGITHYSFFDNDLRFRLGGRFQVDGTLVAPSDQLEAALGPMSDGLDVRRFRIFAEGIFKQMYFRVEFDFAADAGFKSAYLEGRKGGIEIWGKLIGKFRYGLFQEPFSLEENMSAWDTSFIEISMPINTIAPGANLGAMVYDASRNRRFTWAFGVFSWGQQQADNASVSLFSLTGRVGFQPIKYNNKKTKIHVGLSFSSRSPTSNKVRYEALPEARFVRPFADTGDVESNRNTLLGLEAAWRNGSSWAQVDWIRAETETAEGKAHFGGYSLQAGHFLTRYERPWDSLFAVWGRVRPEQNYHGGNPFKKAKGGLWEVAARYSYVDLDDGNVQGGVVRDVTAGVNWYPDATSKIQFNWIYSNVEDLGHANIWVVQYGFAVR